MIVCLIVDELINLVVDFCSVSWRLIAEGANYLEAVIDLHQQEDVNVIFGQLSLVGKNNVSLIWI